MLVMETSPYILFCKSWYKNTVYISNIKKKHIKRPSFLGALKFLDQSLKSGLSRHIALAQKGKKQITENTEK